LRACILGRAVGFNDYEIQLLDRWHSDSYKLYIDNSQARLLSLSPTYIRPYTRSAFEAPSLLFPSYLALSMAQPGARKSRGNNNNFIVPPLTTKARRMDTPSVRVLAQRSRDLIYTQSSSNSSPAQSLHRRCDLYAPDGSERREEINSLKNKFSDDKLQHIKLSSVV